MRKAPRDRLPSNCQPVKVIRMSSDRFFPIQVIGLFVLVFAVSVWLLDGAPVPMRQTVAVEPDPDLPTSADMLRKAQPVDRSSPQFRLDDAGQHLATAAILYSMFPCNVATRPHVVQHAEDYYGLKRNNPNVVFTARTVSLQTGKFLLDERKINRVIGKLFRRGLLTLDEFGYQTRLTLEEFVKPSGMTREEHLRKCLK